MACGQSLALWLLAMPLPAFVIPGGRPVFGSEAFGYGWLGAPLARRSDPAAFRIG